MAYQRYDWNYQKERKRRIADAAAKIADRDEAVRAGRVVPQHADLPIGTGRRVKAAVLFIDICSFTSRPSNTVEEQEDLLQALSIFFMEMFRVVKDYDGVVEKNTGDGLMAYFADSADGNGAERAVACALTMMASNAELTPHVLKTAGRIEFRVAIDYGPITVAQIGAPRLFGSIVAIGITANIANKMLQTASAGQIVIGEEVVLALPKDWWQHCVKLEVVTRFIYQSTGQKYPFYLYDSCWLEPSMPLTELLASAPILPPPTVPPYPSVLEILGRKG